MNEIVRHSLDDTIINDPKRKTSMNIKGVTLFDRQEHLKTLFDQHLKKEDKHLSLEKFYNETKETLLLSFNGLEIGTIPDEHLKMFYSPLYDYELSNIHIDVFTNEQGKDIYWAKLFVIFTPKKNSNATIKQSEHSRNNNTSLNAPKGITSKPKKRDTPIIKNKKTYSSNGEFNDYFGLIGCIVVSLLFLYASIRYFTWYFLLIFLAAAGGVVLFSFEYYKANKIDFNIGEFDLPDTSPIRKPERSSSKVSLEEQNRIINLFRNASEPDQERVLLCLSIEPISKMKTNKQRSTQETKMIKSYCASSKAIQNKVREILKY